MVKIFTQANFQIKSALLTSPANDKKPIDQVQSCNFRQQNRGSTLRRQPQRLLNTISALPRTVVD